MLASAQLFGILYFIHKSAVISSWVIIKHCKVHDICRYQQHIRKSTGLSCVNSLNSYCSILQYCAGFWIKCTLLLLNYTAAFYKDCSINILSLDIPSSHTKLSPYGNLFINPLIYTAVLAANKRT